MKITVVEEDDYGLYIWVMPDGRPVGDSDNNFMCIASKKGDREQLRKLREAARYYGVEEGRPVFLAGQRMITDEEFEEQKQRLAWGLIPDPQDMPAHLEALQDKYKYGR